MALTDIYAPLLPRISPYLKGCELPVQRQMIRDAIRQFCEDTEIWREDVFKLTVEEQTEYDLLSNFHPADTDEDWSISAAELAAYEAAQTAGDTWPTGPNPIPDSYIANAQAIVAGGEVYVFDGIQAEPPDQWVPASESALYDVTIKRAKAVFIAESATQENEHSWTLSPTGILTFCNAHTVDDDQIKVPVIYIPNRDAILFPDWLLDRHGYVITDLALSYLYGLPQRPWSNAAAAKVKMGDYRRGAASVRFEATTERQGGNVTVNSRPFV